MAQLYKIVVEQWLELWQVHILCVTFTRAPHPHNNFLYVIRFPPTDQNKHVRNNLMLSVNLSGTETVNGYLGCVRVPVMDWKHVQGVPHPYHSDRNRHNLPTIQK